MAAEKMLYKSYCAYPSEIIQTSSMGKAAEKSLEHIDYLYVAPVPQRRVRKPSTDNIPSPQDYFQTNYRSVTPMLLKSIGTTLEQFERNFADLGNVFAQ